MQKSFFILLAICHGSVLFGQQTRILGFNDSSTKVELSREKIFDDLISRENIGLTIRDLSSEPHNLGSPGSKVVAEKIEQKYREFGFDVRMDVYDVLFPVPKLRKL